MLVDTYFGHLSQARSLNSVNQVNIAYGNTMTPHEVVELDEALYAPGHVLPALRPDRIFSDAELKTAVRGFIEDAVAHMQLMGKSSAEPFLRRDLRRSVTLYTDGEAPGDKTLIVAIPGANNRLMMPVASLLQALDAASVDIVLIRDPTHTAFFTGLEGLAHTRSGLIAALPDLLNFAAYRRVVALGVSAGGLPALLLAVSLGLPAALVCGGDTPLDPRMADKGGAEGAALLRAAGANGLVTRTTLAFGAQHEADRAAAVELAEFLGIEPLEITNAKGDVQHNLLFALAEEGRLPAFLVERLGL